MLFLELFRIWSGISADTHSKNVAIKERFSQTVFLTLSDELSFMKQFSQN